MKKEVFVIMATVICSCGLLSASVNPFSDAVVRVNFGVKGAVDLNGSILEGAGSDVSVPILNDISYTEMGLKLPNSNDTASVWNKSSSYLNYGIGASEELRITGAFTYYIRFKLNYLADEQYLMGRFGGLGGANSRCQYLTTFSNGNIHCGMGRAAIYGGDGTQVFTAEIAGKISAGVFYDAFFRFIPGTGINLQIWNAQTGEHLGTATHTTSSAVCWDDPDVDFWVGYRGGYGSANPFGGLMDQFAVWKRALTEAEISSIVKTPMAMSRNDLNADGTTNMQDLALFSKNWLECSEPSDTDCMNTYANEIASKRWDSWRTGLDGVFPIAAWSYFQRFVTTANAEQAYTTYKNANMTMVQAPLATEPNAVEVGLKTITGLWTDDNRYARLQDDYSLLAGYVAYPQLSNDGVTGYMITDEPPTRIEMRKLGYANTYVYGNDHSSRLPMANILPYDYASIGGSFQSYIDTYVQLAKPSMIITSCYVLGSTSTDQNRFYNNYEIVRNTTDTYNIGMMGFVLITEHLNYRAASESDIYWQVYSLLAYGAKGIWYYNYQIADAGFGDGIVKTNGTPSAHYPIVQALNSEVLALGSTLLGLKNTKVYHKDDVPDLSSAYFNGAITGITSIAGSNLLISEFENMDNPADESVYVMIVNKKQGAGLAKNASEVTTSVTITVDDNYPYVYGYNKANGALEPLASSQISLDGGEGILLRLSSQEL